MWGGVPAARHRKMPGGVGAYFFSISSMSALKRGKAVRRGDVDHSQRSEAHLSLQSLGLRHICGNLCLGLFAVQVSVEAGHVQADLLSIALEICRLQLSLVGEEHIMHFPELTLLAGGNGCLSSQRRILMEAQWVVLEDNADLVAIGVHNLLNGGIHTGAEGALEFTELHDGDLGVWVPLDCVIGVDLYVVDLGVFRLWLTACRGCCLLCALCGDGRVYLRSGSAFRHQCPGGLQFGIDHLGEARKGLSADEFLPLMKI